MDPNAIIQKTIELLTNYLGECTSEKQDWIFCVHHSLRVEGLVQQILAVEPPLPGKTNLTLRAAGILHDIGNLEGRHNHAENGARIVENLLETKGAFLNDHVSPSQLVSLIRYHTRGIDIPIGAELAILRDADILDQVGAMAILKEANHGDYSQENFYSELYTRLLSETLHECDMIAPQLHTSAAKNILADKRAFIEKFIHQLEEELGQARTFQVNNPA